MFENMARQDRNDERLFKTMLAEVRCMEELVAALESETVTVDDAIGLISGIQRDIVQLYRAAA